MAQKLHARIELSPYVVRKALIMIRSKATNRPKLRIVYVGLALLGMYSSAQGVMISTSAGASFGATTDSHSTTTTDGSTAISAAGVGPASSSAFGRSYGAFAVSNSATGLSASANSSVEFVRNIGNVTGSALHFTYSFYIYGGSLSTNLLSPLGVSETLGASYNAMVEYNGSTLWSSSASVATSVSGSTEVFSGTSLGADSVNDGNYSWSGQIITLDLGVLNPGEDRDITTTLSGSSFSNVGIFSYCLDASTCFDLSKGYATTFYGDPSGAEGLPIEGQAAVISSDPVDTHDVPEPSTLLLLGAASLAGAVARRRFV